VAGGAAVIETTAEEEETTTTAIVVPKVPDVSTEVSAGLEQVNIELASLKDFKIVTQDDMEMAAYVLGEAKTKYKQYEARLQEITKPMREAEKSVRDLFRPMMSGYLEIEKLIKDNDEKLPEDVKTDVQADVDALKTALAGDDIDAVKAAITKLSESQQKLGEAIYSAAQTQEAPAGENASNEDVVDAEVVDEDETK